MTTVALGSDGVVYRFLARGWRLVGLSALWMLVAATIVGVGPATAAVLAVVRHDRRSVDVPTGLLRAFGRGLRDNFRCALLLEVLGLALGAGLWCGWGLAAVVAGTGGVALAVAVAVSTMVLVATLVVAYPMMVHYRVGTIRLLRSAALLAVGRPVLAAGSAATATATIGLVVALPLVGWVVVAFAAMLVHRLWEPTFSALDAMAEGGAA